MTVYRKPHKLSAICFDIDNTLYRNEAYSDSQIRLLKIRLGEEKGWSMEEVEHELDRVKQITEKQQSHGNWFKMLGIPISTSVKWREELLKPGDYLDRDFRLIRTLESLKDYALCALTNNPASIGRKTLDSLGVLELFDLIIGLDDTGSSKPNIEPFIEIEKRLGVPREEIMIVGDRFDVDLDVPLQRGWGAVLVESMEDVYKLAECCPDSFSGGQKV